MSRKNRNASRSPKFHKVGSKMAYLKQRQLDRALDQLLSPLPVNEPERSREATRRAEDAALALAASPQLCGAQHARSEATCILFPHAGGDHVGDYSGEGDRFTFTDADTLRGVNPDVERIFGNREGVSDEVRTIFEAEPGKRCRACAWDPPGEHAKNCPRTTKAVSP